MRTGRYATHTQLAGGPTYSQSDARQILYPHGNEASAYYILLDTGRLHSILTECKRPLIKY